MITGSLSRPDGPLYFDRLGDEPQVLLLHAGGERRHVWHPVMQDLAGQGCAGIAFDQRGHGESTRSSASTLPAFGDDVAAMIAQLQMPVVVGASLGGFAALFALEYPDLEARVAGLVLVDVIPDPDPDHVRRFLAPLGVDKSPLVDDILGRRDHLRKIAQRLSLPILFVRAGKSAVRDADVDGFRALVPHAIIATVAGAGHLIAKEKPAELAALLLDFMNSDAVRNRRASAFR